MKLFGLCEDSDHVIAHFKEDVGYCIRAVTVKLFPNPNNGMWHLTWGEALKDSEATVTLRHKDREGLAIVAGIWIKNGLASLPGRGYDGETFESVKEQASATPATWPKRRDTWYAGATEHEHKHTSDKWMAEVERRIDLLAAKTV